jgi:hypothetical protein
VILVLCDEADVSALWAANALRTRGLSPMLLTGSVLASIERWEHRLGASGAQFELRLPSGVSLHSRETGGILNRLASVPCAWLRRVGGPDRDYALQEMQAFYLSWLHALPGPKLNPPTPQGLCGNFRHPSAWLALASKVGLPARPFRQSSNDEPALAWQTVPAPMTVYVVGARVVGPDAVVQPYGLACLRLAEAADATLLGVDFDRNDHGSWQMSGASVMPDLVGGGEELADALVEALAP